MRLVPLALVSAILASSCASIEPTPAGQRDAPSESSSELLERGNAVFDTDPDESFEAWSKVRRHHPNSSEWLKAVFNLGCYWRARGEPQRAITAFTELRDAEVDDLEPDSNLMEAYRNYRHRAQSEIAECYLELEDYGRALESFRLAVTLYPYQTFCGNCAASRRSELISDEARCHDGLGDARRALIYYFRTPGLSHSRRIVELYEGENELDVLQRLLDDIERHRSPEDDMIWLPSTPLDWKPSVGSVPTFLATRASGAGHDWPSLLETIRSGVAEVEQSTAARGDEYECSFPLSARDYFAHLIVIDAARVLARYPESAGAVISAADAPGEAQRWFWYALGLIGTDAASAALERAIRSVDSAQETTELVYCLGLAGQSGERVLERVATGSADIAELVTRWRTGGLDDEARWELPTTKPREPLPRTFEDLSVEHW